MYGYYYDPTMIILLPAILLSLYAQTKVNSAFSKYLRVPSYSGYTGREVARMILDRNGLYNVRVEPIDGQLTDHYDPRTNVIRLSSSVYNGTSIAALSVAAHETGHAIQHGEGYFPLILRNNIAPVANIGARFVWVLILLGFLMSSPTLVNAGIILYLAVVLFQVVTLPVEFNASRRALVQLESGFVSSNEIGPAKEVLKAAALTYVAATLVAIGQLIRLILSSNRRRD